jgi:hypothetical protein
MKRTLMQLFLAFGAVCSNGLLLHAESYQMTAQVPFAFHAGNAVFPAGTTAVKHSGSNAYQYLQSPDRGSIIIPADNQTVSKKGPCLVFNRYGSEYFLSEVWTESGGLTKLSATTEERNIRERTSAGDVAKISVNITVAP